MKINPDLIFETITNSNGIAYKFVDGTMVCLQKFVLNVVCNLEVKSEEGNATLYYYSRTFGVPNYPVNFIEDPYTQITYYNNNLFSLVPYNDSSKERGSYTNKCCDRFLGYLHNNNSSSPESVYVNVIAIGRWK